MLRNMSRTALIARRDGFFTIREYASREVRFTAA
jgi:hypothetical protein